MTDSEKQATGCRGLEYVQGYNLALRLIQQSDAAYVYDLRTDPAYNRHLSEVSGTVVDQRDWINAYKQREAKRLELYYIIQRLDGTPCGTVRLYNIKGARFTWGSWILDQNKPRKAALESAILSFSIGFEELGLSAADIDVRAENGRAVAFYREFGMTEVDKCGPDIYFVLRRERFMADKQKYLELLAKTAYDAR